MTGAAALALPSAMHGDDHAADRPEQRIFEAGEIPDPFAAAVAPARPGRDQQEHRGERGDVAGVDGEHQADRADHFNGHAGVDPHLRRIEPPDFVDFDGARDVLRLQDEMRNEKQPADDAQDVEFVGQVEALIKVGHSRSPPPLPCLQAL